MGDTMLHDLFSLEGKVALVTGASSGIGRELAVTLAQAGARVALGGRSIERLAATRETITGPGGEAESFPSDLGELDAAQALARDVHAHFGRIDILINCAGMNRRQPATEVLPATYDEIMAVNLRAPFFLSQAVIPLMADGGGGKIINIGSLATTYGLGKLAVYGLMKSAIGQLTRTLAVEWATHNVQVNCICPGWIQTPLNQALWDDAHTRSWILERVPAGRGVPPTSPASRSTWPRGPPISPPARPSTWTAASRRAASGEHAW